MLKNLLTLLFNLVATAIKETVKGAEVVINLVPKEFAMSDIYCQLIPNDDPNEAYYQVMPRMGAFEVSINGVVSKLFYFTNLLPTLKIIRYRHCLWIILIMFLFHSAFIFKMPFGTLATLWCSC